MCKHLVALLLTYSRSPEVFQVIAPMTELLASRSREDLIALVDRMIQQHPDLLYLVELSAPDAAGVPGKPIDVSTYRRKAQSALRRDEVKEIMAGLNGPVDAAQHLLQRDDWLNAGALYAMLLAEITFSYDGEMQDTDYDGDVCGASQDAAAGLSACLSKAQQLDPEIRQEWLTILLEAQFKELELGGIDFAAGADDGLLEWATAEEWNWLEARIRSEIKQRDRWAKEYLVTLLTRQHPQTGSKDANALIHELGTPEQRAFLLVAEGKFEQAIAIANDNFAHLPGLILQFGDALVAANHPELALQFMTQHQTNQPFGKYNDWLSQFHRTHGNPDLALELDYQEFQAHPSFPGYLALRKFAQSLGKREQFRSKLIKHLEQSKQSIVLIDIALEEGEGDRAFKILANAAAWIRSSRAQVVAQAIEQSQPHEAIELYLQLVERAINQRNRGAYQAAAVYLQRMKHLQAVGDWQPYIQTIRSKHATLRALQDELKQAGL